MEYSCCLNDILPAKQGVFQADGQQASRDAFALLSRPVLFSLHSRAGCCPDKKALTECLPGRLAAMQTPRLEGTACALAELPHAIQGAEPRKTPPRREGTGRAPAGGYREADSGADSEAEEDKQHERAAAEQKAAQAAVPAFLTSLEGLDDEVERILAHRCVPVLGALLILDLNLFSCRASLPDQPGGPGRGFFFSFFLAPVEPTCPTGAKNASRDMC